MKVVRRIDEALARIEGATLVALVLGIVVLAALQTFLRNAFDTGLEWGDEALRWATLWVAFLGASLATHRGKHIAIDIASRVLRGRLRRVVAFATSIGAAVFAGLLALGSWRFVRDIGSLEPPLFRGRIPRAPIQAIVPFVFALMSLRFMLQAVLGPRAPRTDDPDEGAAQ